MSASDARIVLDARTIVGESIIWSPREQVLCWVDIVGSTIHCFDPATAAHRIWSTPELPTSIGLRSDGGFIVGLRQRVALWSPGGEFRTLAVPVPDLPGNRLNEGVVAPDGSFWVGTMRDNIAADGQPKPAPDRTGRLYRIAPDGTVTTLSAEHFGITNTMVWLDGGSFVTADTTSDMLWCFDYEPTIRRLTNPRQFVPTPGRGLPDGSTRDRRGTVYNCRVGGGACVASFSASGKVVFIELPCLSPTSCTFGGPDLRTLYVTSARFGMTPTELIERPHEGALIATQLEAQGQVSHMFGA